MKIIIIGPATPLRGGIANFNEALADSLASKGHEVVIFSFFLQYPEILFPGKSQLDPNPVKPEKYFVKSIINSVNPLNWIKVATKLKKEKADLILVRFWIPFMAPCLGTILRLGASKTPVLAIADNIIPHEKRPGDKGLTRFFLNSCQAFVVLSEQVKSELLAFLPNAKVKLLYHPVYDVFGQKVSKQEAATQLNLDPGAAYILFFGFIRKYKGLDLLLDAMNHEKVKKLNMKLIVAGEFYEDEEEYRSFIRKHNLEDRIILHNQFIDNQKVKYYFSLCDLVVQPYRSATQSGVTQIAYHFDKGMLVTNVGGLSEIVSNQRNGYVVQVDSKEVAEALTDFYDRNRKEEFEKESAQLKHRFSWSYFTEELIKLVK